MESVKILFANKTIGAGKSTLCAALANYIINKADENFSLPPIVLDCGNNLFLLNKRNKEINNKSKVPPYEILPLAVHKDTLFTNSINLVSNREAIYLFDISTRIEQTELVRLIQPADIVICPFILSEDSIFDTADFVLFVKKTDTILIKSGYKKDPSRIILIPNMVDETETERELVDFWEVKKKMFENICVLADNIQWRGDLLEDISTINTDFPIEFQDLMGRQLDIIMNVIKEIYKIHYERQS